MTGAEGRFVFVDVLAGTYGVSAALEGFKTVARRDVSVGSTDRVDVPPLVLEAGDVRETISVHGGADLVQTTTAARGGRITHDTLDDIATQGT